MYNIWQADDRESLVSYFRILLSRSVQVSKSLVAVGCSRRRRGRLSNADDATLDGLRARSLGVSTAAAAGPVFYAAAATSSMNRDRRARKWRHLQANP